MNVLREQTDYTNPVETPNVIRGCSAPLDPLFLSNPPPPRDPFSRDWIRCTDGESRSLSRARGRQGSKTDGRWGNLQRPVGRAGNFLRSSNRWLHRHACYSCGGGGGDKLALFGKTIEWIASEHKVNSSSSRGTVTFHHVSRARAGGTRHQGERVLQSAEELRCLCDRGVLPKRIETEGWSW